MTIPTRIKLPREIEADPKHESLIKLLTANETLLWEKGTIRVPRIPLTSALEDALTQALNFKTLERGLEQAEKILQTEKKGLAALQAKQGTAPANRASRILLIANDGAERFYRSCESLLSHHGDRVLGIQLEAGSERLGLNLFGPAKPVKALLVTDRDAVTQVLRSLLK